MSSRSAALAGLSRQADAQPLVVALGRARLPALRHVYQGGGNTNGCYVRAGPLGGHGGVTSIKSKKMNKKKKNTKVTPNSVHVHTHTHTRIQKASDSQDTKAHLTNKAQIEKPAHPPTHEKRSCVRQAPRWRGWPSRNLYFDRFLEIGTSKSNPKLPAGISRQFGCSVAMAQR